jgi:hypothetical protein
LRGDGGQQRTRRHTPDPNHGRKTRRARLMRAPAPTLSHWPAIERQKEEHYVSLVLSLSLLQRCSLCHQALLLSLLLRRFAHCPTRRCDGLLPGACVQRGRTARLGSEEHRSSQKRPANFGSRDEGMKRAARRDDVTDDSTWAGALLRAASPSCLARRLHALVEENVAVLRAGRPHAAHAAHAIHPRRRRRRRSVSHRRIPSCALLRRCRLP